MSSNCHTYIKQEFLTAEEQLSSIPGTDLNILVKNEPISDEPFSAVTIKTEPLVEAASLIETVSIKTEHFLQSQEAVSASRESFVIYELDPQTQKTGKKTSNEFSPSVPHNQFKNTIHATKTVLQSTESSLISNLNQTNLVNVRTIHGISTKAAGPPPILLNDKLRKRHKVVITAKTADKRKRYNIEGTPSALLEKSNNTRGLTDETSKTSRLLNSENKKIINHTIKHERKQKQKQQQSLENCDLLKLATIITNDKSQITEQNFIVNYLGEMEQPITQTQAGTLTPISATVLPLPARTDTLNSPRQLADSPVIPELRVKCLCSLTGDTSTDNSELSNFFEEMFRQTRRLDKTQQRKVKMLLLKAICDAEDCVEQGKCCGF